MDNVVDILSINPIIILLCIRWPPPFAFMQSYSNRVMVMCQLIKSLKYIHIDCVTFVAALVTNRKEELRKRKVLVDEKAK